MKQVGILTVVAFAASWLGIAPVHAAKSRAAKIKRLRAEAKIVQLNAQAVAERVAAYEEA